MISKRDKERIKNQPGNTPLIRAWTLVAIMEDGTEKVLNPDGPFVGDVFDAREYADRIAGDMGNIESFELVAGPIGGAASLTVRHDVS